MRCATRRGPATSARGCRPTSSTRRFRSQRRGACGAGAGIRRARRPSTARAAPLAVSAPGVPALHVQPAWGAGAARLCNPGSGGPQMCDLIVLHFRAPDVVLALGPAPITRFSCPAACFAGTCCLAHVAASTWHLSRPLQRGALRAWRGRHECAHVAVPQGLQLARVRAGTGSSARAAGALHRGAAMLEDARGRGMRGMPAWLHRQGVMESLASEPAPGRVAAGTACAPGSRLRGPASADATVATR